MNKLIKILIIFSSFLVSQQLELGQKLVLETTTSVSSLLNKPELYLGKQVQIKGTIVDVCNERGCWIEVAEDSLETIRVKVQDGVIVFPEISKGKKVTAEGILEKLIFSEEGALRYKKHQYEEKGEKFDESTVKITEADKTIIRLRGLGAVIGK